MGSRDDGLTIEEAARALGWSAKTVRRRIKDGSLAAHKEHTPQGYTWRVHLPAEAAPAVTTSPGQLTTGEVAALVQLLTDELQRTRERVAALEARQLAGPPVPVVLPREEIEADPPAPPPAPVELPREVIPCDDAPAQDVSHAGEGDSAPPGFLARLWARWRGEG